jgi:RHS repeat-associated protein
MDVLPTGGGTVALLGSAGIDTFNRGNKFFELSNHLGNVLVTVSDRKFGQSPVNNLYTSFTADVVSATDYAPFGMQMVGRSFDAAGSTAYRYGFNGQEKTPEVSSSSFTAEYWQYDSRIARRWNVDPVVKPYESPYATFGNNPIWNVDPDGADTAKYLSNGQLVDAIKISYNVINNAVKSKTYSPSKDVSAILQSEIDKYWESHQSEFSAGAYSEFRDQVFNSHKGLKEVATASSNAWERYGQRILNNNIDPETAILQTYFTIQAYNGRSMDLVKMGANVAMGMATGGVGIKAGIGPRAPFKSGLTSPTQSIPKVLYNGNKVPVYRGENGNDPLFQLKGGEYKFSDQTVRGLSINVDAAKLSNARGNAYQITQMPKGLTIVQHGAKDPGHFEIVPTSKLSQEEFQGLLNQIKYKRVN